MFVKSHHSIATIYILTCSIVTIDRDHAEEISSAVADPGGPRGPCPPPLPGPVKISLRKDDHRRRLHRFHVSLLPSTAGSASALVS